MLILTLTLTLTLTIIVIQNVRVIYNYPVLILLSVRSLRAICQRQQSCLSSLLM